MDLPCAAAIYDIHRKRQGGATMGIAGNEWGFQVGTLPKGARDKISDVPGVTVGPVSYTHLAGSCSAKYQSSAG